MSPVYQFSLIVATALVLSGCSKKEAADAGAAPAEAAAAAPAPETPAAPGKDAFPGAGEIRTALAAKNYEQAVGQLVSSQALLATPEQRIEWGNILQEVRDALLEASPTNPKAAEALATLRQIRAGR